MDDPSATLPSTVNDKPPLRPKLNMEKQKSLSKIPPQLPPKTYKSRKSSSSGCGSRPPPKIIDETEYSSEQLVAEKPLPQMVAVASGYHGATPEKCVSVGEEFVIQLVKSTKLLPAKLVDGTEELYLPINSMLSLGIVREDEDKIYSTVRDLLKLSDLPMVVVVNHAFTCKLHNDEYHVGKDSILYITGRDGNNALYCQHESGGQNLTLAPNVMGRFSTDPADATIFIADYVRLLSIYPVTIRLLQKGVDVDDQLLAQYIGETFILEKPIEKQSLIATTDVNGTRIDNPALVEIPMDIPLSFKCIERPELDVEKMYSNTCELYSEFDPNKIDKLYGVPVVSESDYAYYESIDNDECDDEYVYVTFDITCPNPRTETLQRALQKHWSKSVVTKPASEENKTQSSAAEHLRRASTDSDKMTAYTEKSPNNQSTNKMSTDGDLAHQQVAVEEDHLKTSVTDNKVDDLQLQLSHSEQNCANMEAELVRVKKIVSKLTDRLEQLTDQEQAAPEAAKSQVEENQERLRNLTVADISRLLKCMGYQMYEEIFMAECVDGMLLSTLEEEHLKELGIKSSIHCRRFMNIIQGRECVDKYFLK